MILTVPGLNDQIIANKRHLQRFELCTLKNERNVKNIFFYQQKEKYLILSSSLQSFAKIQQVFTTHLRMARYKKLTGEGVQ